MKKHFSSFETDEEAERFVATADLTDYDITGGKLVQFELKSRETSVSIQLPKRLLDAVRDRAASAGVSDQRFIRMAIERALEIAK